MADIRQLQLNPPDPIDWDNYDTGGSAPAKLPQVLDSEGNAVIFKLRIDGGFEFRPTRNGDLMAVIDTMSLVGVGEFDNTPVRFTYASAKQFTGQDGKPQNRSALGNYLKAAGMKIPNGVDNQTIANMVEATKGRVVNAALEWVAYDKETGTEYKGFSNFPPSGGWHEIPWSEARDDV